MVTAGNGVTVTGNGSPDAPYEIFANSGALEVADTDTVDLTLSGAGTNTDPYHLTGDARVSAADGNLLTVEEDGLAVACDAVQDCIGQAAEAGQGIAYDDAGNALSVEISTDAGNAVTRGSDGGVFATGVGATTVVGCGLTGDGSSGSPLAVAPAPWGFPCDAATSGQGLACDGGRLYGPPVQRVWTAGFSGGDLTFTPASGTSADGFDRSFTLEVTNPDPCRSMQGLAHLAATARINLAGGSEVTVGISGDTFHRYGNSGAATRQRYIRMNHPLVLNIPAGGTQTLRWDVFTTLANGTAEVVLVACSIRLMGVSQ